MRHLTRTIDGLEMPIYRRLKGESMIMCGDLHATCNAIENRLIDSAMPELELVCLKTKCATKKLMTETNTESRYRAMEDLSHQGDRLLH